MNWFLCVLGLLGVATVVCLCLHQYEAAEGARGEETYVDYTPLTTETEQVAADAQDLSLDLLGLTPLGDGTVAKEEQMAEEEEEGSRYAVAAEEEEGSRYTAAAEEEEAVSTRKRTPPPAEEEATRAPPASLSLDVASSPASVPTSPPLPRPPPRRRPSPKRRSARPPQRRPPSARRPCRPCCR